MSKFVAIFLSVFIITVLSGLIYISLQQNYRLTANDPQIQIAEDTAALLNNNFDAHSFVPSNLVDISKSLGTFIIIFDDKGQPFASSAVLGGKTPVPPLGVFDYTKKQGEHRFTWQPEKGIRIATVIVGFNGKQKGYVLAGRSLREVEKRIDKLTLMIGLGWLASIVIVSFTLVLKNINRRKS